MGLAAAADIVIATARARFALTETSLGFPPAQIAPYLAARMGERIARRLAMTGARIDGREAETIGLADFYCDSDAERDAKLEALLQAAERCAPGANAETKRLFRLARSEPPESYIEAAAQSFADALRGPEGREGVAAFLEKRAPSWTQRRMSARFSSVLVANRGEIACRVIRAAHAEGLRAIAVFSDADADALHVRLADAAVRIGPPAPAQSYLVDRQPDRGGEEIRRRGHSSGLRLPGRERGIRGSRRRGGACLRRSSGGGDPRHGRQGGGQGADGGGRRPLRAGLPWRRPESRAFREGSGTRRLSPHGQSGRRRRRPRHARRA